MPKSEDRLLYVCPRCKNKSLFIHRDSHTKECFECGFKMSHPTLDDLKSLYFGIPMTHTDGDAQQGDMTNWEAYWAWHKWIATKTKAAMLTAGWDGDAYVIRLGTQNDFKLFQGESPEEAMQKFMEAAVANTIDFSNQGAG